MSTEKILVVDDERDFCEFMVNHLRRRDYTVEKANDGVEALKVLQTRGPFAVLVTDLNMPNLDGIGLLRRARQLDPQMEVIVISANDAIEMAIAAMREYGAYDYLHKPLANHNQLSVAVARAAEYRRLRLERETLQAQRLADAERLQVLVANTGDAIIATDSEGNIAIANPAAAHLLGQPNLVGANAMGALPRSLTTLVTNWKTLSNSRPAVVEIPWGADSAQMVSLAPLNPAGFVKDSIEASGVNPSANGKSSAWVMVLRDITHIKRLDEFKVRLLADAANKIQIPLSLAVASAIELNYLSNSIKMEQFTKSVYGLGRALDQIRKWMDELLLIARIDSGIGVNSEVLNVPEAVQGWAETANKKILKGKSLSLNVKVSDNVPPIYADRELMQRLLQQLTEQISSVARPEPGSALNLTVRHHEDQVWIDATLAGFPIRKTDPLRRLMGVAPGAPANPSSNAELSLMLTIAHSMGGQVWLREQDMAGNAIVICFPAVKPKRE
jgi:CheY-like chemotaxis protein